MIFLGPGAALYFSKLPPAFFITRDYIRPYQHALVLKRGFENWTGVVLLEQIGGGLECCGEIGLCLNHHTFRMKLAGDRSDVIAGSKPGLR